MGLSFHVDGYEFDCSFSYASFHEFRKKIAFSIGIDLEEMQGFRKRHPVDKDYVKIGYKSWNDVKSPLKYLLNHQDDTGFLNSEQCKIIVPHLKMILILWEDEEISIFKQNGLSLVDAMEYCAEFKKKLNFS
jgi:hypothetical protein